MRVRCPGWWGPGLDSVRIQGLPPSGGDGLDDLAILDGGAVPMEVGSKVPGGLSQPGADDEVQVRFIQCLQVRGGEHAGVSRDDHVGDLVTGLEVLDDRDHRAGLGQVPLETADIEREPGAVHEQPDHDLGIHATFLGEPDLAELVFLLRFEIQSCDVVEEQGHVTHRADVVEALAGDRLPVAAVLGALHGVEQRVVMRY